MIDLNHPRISIARQCELLDLSRASLYAQPRPVTALEDLLLRRIDEIYTRCPFYGVRRITAWLRRQGHDVNPKRVRRLMRLMGLYALYPKRTLSLPAPGQTTYPYLLRDLTIERPGRVWAADISVPQQAASQMRVWPLAGGLQEQMANHRKRPWSTATVVSVAGKVPRGIR